MEEIINKINNSSWADWNLEKIELNFETVIVYVSNSDGDVHVKITCTDYVGFQVLGHWDEAIIEEIKVHHEGEIINESIRMVNNHYGEDPVVGGGVKKVNDDWLQVNIKLIDGINVTVACKTVDAE